MSRTLQILQLQFGVDGAGLNINSCYVHGCHCDSVKTNDKVRFEKAVEGLDYTKALDDTADLMTDIVADCKEYITNSGAYAGGTYMGNDYDAETWDN